MVPSWTDKKTFSRDTVAKKPKFKMEPFFQKFDSKNKKVSCVMSSFSLQHFIQTYDFSANAPGCKNNKKWNRSFLISHSSANHPPESWIFSFCAFFFLNFFAFYSPTHLVFFDHLRLLLTRCRPFSNRFGDIRTKWKKKKVIRRRRPVPPRIYPWTNC